MPKLAGVPAGSGVDPCCCETECCMYPADVLGIGDYTEDDLPAAVTVNGVSKPRSGSGYGDTTDGVIWESGVWAVYVAGERTTQNCLISGVVEDQFAATYTVSSLIGTFLSPYTVTRVSLCSWEVIPQPECSEPNSLGIYYDDSSNEWVISYDTLACGGTFDLGTKDTNQSTPVGTYLDSFGDPIFVVS